MTPLPRDAEGRRDDRDRLADVFTFTASPRPAVRLSFSSGTRTTPPAPATPPPSRRKRPRPLADVDGEGSEYGCKKKRRLRLRLITSRLSRPFSSPPTHIVDRGASKIAVWAKQKALGRNLLRKAAILNRVRRQIEAARELEQREMELARQAFMQVPATVPSPSCCDAANPSLARQSRHQSSVSQIPRRQYIPLPPSPLGLSNYDAFDLDDDDDGGAPPAAAAASSSYGENLDDDDDDNDDDENGGSMIYSDFNILEPAEPVVDDYDSLDLLDMLPHDHGPRAAATSDHGPRAAATTTTTTTTDEKRTEMMREKERQKGDFVCAARSWTGIG
ncbi:MAG: hypothetical protein M1837_001636 [Sclerophora amabilis]|nr:MAG: hypothetical protein M1837_001636 [Sclerophora amabilis]